MLTLHSAPENGHRIVMKGAPEVVLGYCDRLGDGGTLDPAGVTEVLHSLTARGLRVLAVASVSPQEAMTTLPPPGFAPMALLGLVASMDPPRAEAVAAIATCHQAGVVVKMVTGDHPGTAKAIGVEIGITEPGDAVVTGDEIERMNQAQLEWTAPFVNVFSRVAPEHKLRLVRALQARGDVVAMTGDGVNDAPALKQADVGVAMGITGTAAAKEAAAIILVDDNFASIAAAVEGGRRCYDGSIKALMFVVPTNLGQSLVSARRGAPRSPSSTAFRSCRFVPLQILWVNLVTGVTLAIPLAFEVPEPDIMSRPPRQRSQPIFTRQLGIRCLLVGSVMATGAIALFLDEYYGEIVMPHGSPEPALRKAQTLVATTVVLFQVFYLFQCRSLRTSVFKMSPWSNPAIYWGIAIALAMQVAFVHTSVMNQLFHSAPIGLRDWLACTAVAACILPLMAMEKSLYEKHVWAQAVRRSSTHPRPGAPRPKP